MEVAADRNMLPSEFYAASYEDRLIMMAHYKSKSLMAAWSAKESERKAKLKSK